VLQPLIGLLEEKLELQVSFQALPGLVASGLLSTEALEPFPLAVGVLPLVCATPQLASTAATTANPKTARRFRIPRAQRRLVNRLEQILAVADDSADVRLRAVIHTTAL